MTGISCAASGDIYLIIEYVLNDCLFENKPQMILIEAILLIVIMFNTVFNLSIQLKL